MSRRSVPDVPTKAFPISRRFVPDIPKGGTRSVPDPLSVVDNLIFCGFAGSDRDGFGILGTLRRARYAWGLAEIVRVALAYEAVEGGLVVLGLAAGTLA